jgi:hypothetical protein
MSHDSTIPSPLSAWCRSRPWAATAVLAVFGGAITVASWVGGEHGLALGLGIFYVVSCVAAYLWSRGRGDVAAIMRLSGDERQRLMDTKATAVAGLATMLFCLGGAVFDLARGGDGTPWTLICGVGGATYAVALGLLVRRA